jgi:uncharacterized membrane protein YecN with MAPEG domain
LPAGDAVGWGIVSGEQRTVLLGMVAGLGASALFFWVGHAKLPAVVPVLMDPLERLAYAVSWQAVTVVPLAAGVARIATRRFFTKEAIGGDNPALDRGLEIDRRYVQNTVEQLALASPAQLALALALPATSLRLVVLAAVWFVIARVAFWVGYHRSPLGRGFGFVSTFSPTLAMLAYCIYRLAPR